MAKREHNKALFWTILLISLIQMSHLAIAPGIDLISKEFAAEQSFQTVQAVTMSLPSIMSVVSGVTAALLLGFGLASKRNVVFAGLLSLSLTGVAALLLHSHFWHLLLFNSLIGISMGAYIPSAQSIMFDNFDEKNRRFLSGAQSAFINGGGIVMSVVGGILTTRYWYGGHLVMLAAVPVLIVSFITIPKDKPIARRSDKQTARTKLPGQVYYYAFLIFLFMLMYNIGPGNASTHIANGNLGDASTAGVATALMMAGGVVSGFMFPKLSPVMGEHIFPFSIFLMFSGYLLMGIFPTSLFITLLAMFLCGSSLSLYIPRCVFRVSNITDPTNSALATVMIACLAPGFGSFLSPIIMTNLTMALGGESTVFRYTFSACICLVIAVILLLHNIRLSRKEKSAA